MELTEKERLILVWLVLGEYGECIERAHEVAGKQLDFHATDRRREKYEKMRVELNERIILLEILLSKLGYKPGVVESQQ